MALSQNEILDAIANMTVIELKEGVSRFNSVAYLNKYFEYKT